MSQTQEQYNDRLKYRLLKYFNALKGDDYPRDGLISHHGLCFGLKNDSIGLAPRFPQERGSKSEGPVHTLVTIYRVRKQYRRNPGDDLGRQIGYSLSTHQGRVRAVSEALQAPVADTWNGGHGYAGVSVVLDLRPPEALITCVLNYYKLDDVFAHERNEPFYRRFNQWYDRQLGDAIWKYC